MLESSQHMSKVIFLYIFFVVFAMKTEQINVKGSAVPIPAHYTYRSDSDAQIVFSLNSGENESSTTPEQRSLFSVTFDVSNGECLKNCMLSVVYECTNDLQLLSHVFSSRAKSVKVTGVPYKTLVERFGKATHDDQKIVGEMYSDTHRLQKIIGLVLYLLDRLIDEVKKYGTCTLVREFVENITRMRQDEEDLMRKLVIKRRELERLRRAFVNDKTAITSLANTVDNVIRNTLISINDEIEASLVGVKYVKKWQDARYEQNSLQLEQSETNYKKLAEQMRFKTELEERCHGEVKNYMGEAHNDYMDQIQGWMEHYEGALDSKEMDIFNLRMQVEKQKDQFETMKATYEWRSIEIENYLESKRKKKEAEDLLVLQIWAAMIIQAWWRGVMVRCKLGPHAKKKGKGKGKAEKSQKKTKKRKK